MEAIYKDISSPGGLGGENKLYKESLRKKIDVNRTDVKNFLRSQSSYTKHLIQPNKFPRRYFMVSRAGKTICFDIAYLIDYSLSNNGFKYLLVGVDMFSRYLNVFPLKSLKASEISENLNLFFKNNIFSYEKIFTDLGSEFIAKQSRAVYKKYNILHYSTENREIKASLVEIVIRTLKQKIGKYITHFNTERYIDVLPEIINTYNHTDHRGLLYHKPIDIHLMLNQDDIHIFAMKVYKRKFKHTPLTKVLLQTGTVVRLKHTRSSQHVFRKAYHVRNTEELFKIINVNNHHVPVTYKVADLENSEIKGNFYRQEIVPCLDSELYKINILKKRKRKNKIEYLVQYINYPASTPRWVPLNYINNEKHI